MQNPFQKALNSVGGMVKNTIQSIPAAGKVLAQSTYQSAKDAMPKLKINKPGMKVSNPLQGLKNNVNRQKQQIQDIDNLTK